MKKFPILRSFITSLIRYNTERERTASILYSIIVAVSLGLCILIIERVLVRKPDLIPGLSISLCSLIFTVYLVRRGWLRAAGGLLLGTLMAFILYQCLHYNGFHDSAISAVPALLIIAALILKRKMFFLFAAVVLASLLMLGYLEMAGVIRNRFSSLTNVQELADVAIVLSITSLTLRLIADTLFSKLEQAQNSEADIRRAEQENRLLAQTVKSVKDCISITDLDERIIFVNDAFLAQYGYREEEILGRHISILRSPAVSPETTELIYPATMAAGWHGELMNRRKDGTDFMVELWTSGVRDNHGTVNATVGVARDITERKRVERQLIQAQKLDSIGTLAGGIAHDFNNLLAMVLGAAELLNMQIKGQPELKINVDRIISAAERGRSISRRLLNFSRPGSARLEPVSPLRLVAELREMLVCFFPKSITVETAIEDGIGMINGDPGQLHQALLNLALNAADAMDHVGRISITVAHADQAVVGPKLGKAEERAHAVISVADNGAGMDESTIAKIFDPFFSTKEEGKGTGLGLSIVQGITQSHGGFIDVESRPGEGTRFSLYFPIVETPAYGEVTETIQVVRTNNETILLVDDEQLLREMLADYLRACGYTIITAVDGHDALNTYLQHRASIDLVLTDLGMPGMDGDELYEELRRIDPAVNVIIASGFLDGVTKNSLLEMGVKDVLTKPFNLIHLQSALAWVLSPPDALSVRPAP